MTIKSRTLAALIIELYMSGGVREISAVWQEGVRRIRYA